MREILFRAWVDCGEGLPEMVSWNDVRSNFGWYQDDDMIKLMQYTGLTDKNGVKIFEGDVVERNHMGTERITRHIVEYKKYSDSGGYISVDYMGYEDVSFGTVIGNIHQHPHLIP